MKMLVMALAVVSGVFGFKGTAFAADGLECKDARGCKICSAILPNPPPCCQPYFPRYRHCC